MRKVAPLVAAIWLVACSSGSTGADVGSETRPGSDLSASLDATAPLDDVVTADKASPDGIEEDVAAPADLVAYDVADTTADDVAGDLSDVGTDIPDDVELVELDLAEPEDVLPEVDVPQTPPLLFDHELIQDATDAACTFDNHHTTLKDGVLLDVWHVTYTSYEVIDGQLQPIQIQGFAARPAMGGTGLPGVINAHGLGGFAKEANATGTSALLGMFVLAYTGPGGGDAPDNTSGGLPASYADGYRMFDVLTDKRGTWFWGHAVAAMRGLTCLENHPDVDPQRLGITGFSAGGVISNLVSGVDPRVKAGVPLSGVLAWNVATQSPEAWQNDLLTEAGLTTDSPEWQTLMEFVDPSFIYGPTSAPVMIANGSSDEFFPLTAHMATFGAIQGEKRTSFSANFDHGCYMLTGGESAQTIEERADLRAKGAQQLWFHHFFGTDERFSKIPAAPTFTASALGMATTVVATVDPGGSKLEVENVHVWWSNDDAFLFGSVELKEQAPGVYGELCLFPLQGNSVLYVDVQYKTKDWLNPVRFSLSSAPMLPADFVPHIRDVNSCL